MDEPPLWQQKNQARLAKKTRVAEMRAAEEASAALAREKNAAAANAADALAANGEQQPPPTPSIPVIAAEEATSLPRDFLTATTAASGVHKPDIAQKISESSPLSGGPKVPRAEPKIKLPVLPMHFPPVSMSLPMQNIFLTPYQRPPQLWDLDQQVQALEGGQPNPYQRQQFQRLIQQRLQGQQQKEQQELQIRQQLLELQQLQAQPDNQQQQEQQQQQEDQQQQEGQQQDRSVDGVDEESVISNVDSEQELEELLDQYKARAAESQAKSKKIAQEQQRIKEQQARHESSSPDGENANTEGLVNPKQYEGRPFAEKQAKMMDAAAKLAGSGLAQKPKVIDSPSRENEEVHQDRMKSLELDAERASASFREKIRSFKAGKRSLSPHDQHWLDEEDRKWLSESNTRVDKFFDAYIIKREALAEVDLRTGEQKKEDRELIEKVREMDQKIERTLEKFMDSLGPQSDPPSPPMVNDNRQEQTPQDPESAIVNDDAKNGNPGGEEDGEYTDGYDDDDDDDDDDDYDESEYSDGDEDDDDEDDRPPPIAVKNAEELASVLDRLAAEGVRAEVVRGTATRYIEPPEVTPAE